MPEETEMHQYIIGTAGKHFTAVDPHLTFYLGERKWAYHQREESGAMHGSELPYSTYYKPMMYYKHTTLFSSKFLHRYRTLVDGNSYYKPMMYCKPTPCSELM